MKTTIIEPCEQYPNGAILTDPDTEAPNMAAMGAATRVGNVEATVPTPVTALAAKVPPVLPTVAITEGSTDG